MKPTFTEFPPYYQSYYELLPDGDPVMMMRKQRSQLLTSLSSISEEESLFAYEPGKWTIRELLGHLTDQERVFAFRAMSLARGEKNPLPGMDHDAYVKAGDFNSRLKTDILNEYIAVRESSVLLFESFSGEVLKLKGIVNGYETSVEALKYIIPAHELHHVNVLMERYLKVLRPGA
ncbi:hypothetical protein BAC3_02041 [uncultured bacterium]|nr:hypothetical protein BAC3_02041 [uncultured bacterium]